MLYPALLLLSLYVFTAAVPLSSVLHTLFTRPLAFLQQSRPMYVRPAFGQEFLYAGGDPNMRDSTYLSPLHNAAIGGSPVRVFRQSPKAQLRCSLR